MLSSLSSFIPPVNASRAGHSRTFLFLPTSFVNSGQLSHPLINSSSFVGTGGCSLSWQNLHFHCPAVGSCEHKVLLLGVSSAEAEPCTHSPSTQPLQALLGLSAVGFCLRAVVDQRNDSRSGNRVLMLCAAVPFHREAVPVQCAVCWSCSMPCPGVRCAL